MHAKLGLHTIRVFHRVVGLQILDWGHVIQ